MKEPIYFSTPEALRAWFVEHADTEPELFVVFHSKASGKPTLTWSEAVDEALCVGWIDSVARRIDETSRAQRFSPRKASSNWSDANVAKVAKLTAEGRMTPAGLAAYERRTAARSGVYSFEQGDIALDADQLAALQDDAAAWSSWEAQPSSYRKPAIWWVISAKRPETQAKRLAALIQDSAAGVRVKHLRRP